MNSNHRVFMLPAMLTARLSCFALCLLTIWLAVGAPSASAQTETVLYKFCSQKYCADGTIPAATLMLDSQGNLFGAAEGGPSKSYAGILYEISSNGGGEALVYDFTAFQQGVAPNGALARDSSGTFYGTTAGGGYAGGKCKKYYGCGVVYKVSNGAEQVLYTFQGKSDGLEPNGGVVVDKSGNVYGTTYKSAGAKKGLGPGIVYKVSASGTLTILHQFGTSKGDGKRPVSGLIMDANGNLYGTTGDGGTAGDYAPGLKCSDGCGTVYEITAGGQEKILHTFLGSEVADGAAPFGALVMDSHGNLYGTTYAGGTYGAGTIFKLTPSGQETVLYSFFGIPDAGFPVGRLLLDSKGNLFGTSSYGGTFDTGAVFELSAAGTESVLYSFTGSADGGYPFDGLVEDASGNLYGTTLLGGNFGNSCPNGCGVVFKVGK